MENEEPSITQNKTEELVRLLCSRKIAEQVKGKRLLAGTGILDVDALLKILDAEQQKLRLRKRYRKYLIPLHILIILGLNYLWYLLYPRVWFNFPAVYMYLFSGVLFAFFSPSVLHHRILKMLTRHDDVRMVSVLVDNIDYLVARKRLLQLLPRLQASDAISFNAEQRQKLYSQLKWDFGWQDTNSDNYECVMAILKALEQIGDAEAIPHIERLIQRATNPQIRTAAEECLPFLQDRGHQRQPAETLLRPSQSSTPPDMLLRPAVSTIDTEPQQLLRASSESDAGMNL